MTRGRRIARGTTALGLALSLALVRPEQAHADVPPPTDLAAPLPSHDIRWSGTVGAAVDVGSLPRAAPGLALGFDVRRGALGLRVVTSAFGAQRDHASGMSIAAFDTLIMICALAPIGSSVDLGACGGGGLGLLRAEGAASAPADSVIRFRPEGIATTRFDVSLFPALWVSLEAGVTVDPLRTRLPLAGDAEAHRASLVAFRSTLSLYLRVW